MDDYDVGSDGEVERRGVKRGRRHQTKDDGSMDSEDYEQGLNELKYALSQVDPKERLRHCHDKRLEVRRDLWATHFLPAHVPPPPYVEPWAYGIKARLDAIRALVGGGGGGGGGGTGVATTAKIKGGDAFQRTIGAAMAQRVPVTCDDMITLFEREFGLDFSSAIVPLSDEGYVLWVFNR